MCERILIALLLVGAACADELPSGLRRTGEVAAAGSRSVAAFAWKLPGEAGELTMVEVQKDLWIGRTEVTCGQLRAWARATKTALPGSIASLGDEHPAVDVTWDEARAFCAWAGLALPTLKEWERAASGGDARAFPWGDEAGGVRGNFCDRSCPEEFEWRDRSRDDGHAYTAPVGSFPAGVSPTGALDMGGNAWEWCADGEGGERPACGGGWCSPVETGAVSFRNAFPRDTRWAGLGFRAVKRR